MRIAVADIAQPVRSAAIEEHRVTLIQDDRLLFDLVFDTAFQDILAFEGIRADHLPPAGLLLQLEQHHIGCLRSNAAGEYALIRETFDRLLGEMLFFPLPHEKNVVL